MAAELVGGALLSAFLQVAFDRLASPDILHFFRRRRLDDTLLNNLKIKLLFINSLVDDAEQKQISNTYVQAWVDELKDAVYDAEFILDEIDYEVTKRKVEEAELQETAFNKVRNFFSASVSSFNKQVETRMRKVLEKLEYLASQKDILQLKERGGGAGFQNAREVGEQFFNVLLSRSFFQRSTEDETRFVMHDLINDLAKDVSGKFCHRMEIDKAYNLTEKTRHVSHLRNDLETSERFKDIFLAKRLHTFLPLSMHDQRQTGYFRLISRNMIHDLLSNFRCLRVLSLSGYCNNVNLPDSVGNLKHLRYLDLSGSKVKKLPDSICLLYNLQTLKLRYCELLEKLPLDLHKLINLRHLDFSKTKVKEMPKKLGNLKNLQILSSFHVGKCSETNIKQLKELNIRGAISILELQNIVYPMDAFESNFKNKMYLEELSLEWSVNNNQSQDDKDVLEKLQPHQNLKKLSIRNYGGIEFPDWLADLSLSNVVSLKLSNCKNCLSLPSLGLLTSLKSLSIIGFDSVVAIGPEFYGNTSCTIPFGSLRILRFKDMVGWEKWNCENVSGIFLHLQELSLENCPKLKEEFPVQLPSLEKLIIECSEHFIPSVSWSPSLKVLGLNGRFTECSSTEKIESTIANTCLEDLTISNCANLEFPLCQYHNFICKMMIERSCDSLRSFPLDLFPKLRSLHLIECSNLEMISVSEGHNHKLTSLTYLAIIKCPKFVSFPKGGILDPKLHTLEIRELESLKSLPRHEEGLLSNLKSLLISECPKLMASQMVWELHNHTSLAWLQIKDTNLECFPDGGLLPPNLTLLGLLHCSNLRRLGNSISHLSALKIFNLFNCPKLQYLPNEGLPSSLSNLKIDGCPLLKKRFHKQKGSDWAMTAHIPHMAIIAEAAPKFYISVHKNQPTYRLQDCSRLHYLLWRLYPPHPLLLFIVEAIVFGSSSSSKIGKERRAPTLEPEFPIQNVVHAAPEHACSFWTAQFVILFHISFYG
ncbi:putative disease resistance protein [Senna tora]|uniref:Putative disease resistance protein n=1 Tax=Senna tora TaxID=362788 RepID=A0A834WKW6_9FABA|nr:putative disease resistance protein [Senna tora]